MTVYGDLLFLINFSMDFLCFYICCLLLRCPLPLFRTCVASALGGVYSVAALFIVASPLASFLLDVLCCALMCIAVFWSKKTSGWHIFKGIAVYFFVSMLLGGIMTALYSLLNRAELFSGESEGEGISVWIFALLALAGGTLSVLGGRFFRTSSARRETVITVSDGKNEVELRALADSGNLAADPISGRSVVIATLRSAEKIVPRELYPVFLDVANIEKLPVGDATRIRLIPSSTLSGNTLIPALKMKKIKIRWDKKEKYADALVAFVNVESFDGYDAIVSTDLMT